jgi:putative ATP-binding cassette transporter
LVAALLGVTSGAATAALLSMVTRAVTRPLPPNAGRAFLGLCIVYATLRVVSQRVLASVSQGAIADTRVHLVRQVLRTPLRTLEDIGEARLYTILTLDVQNLSVVIADLPQLVVHIATAVGLLLYLMTVSAWLPATIIGAATIGFLLFQLLQRPGIAATARLRTIQDRVYRALHGLTRGAKELQLSKARRDDFMDRVLMPEVDALKATAITSQTHFGLAGMAESLSIFGILGAWIFVLPHFLPASVEWRAALVAGFGYLIGPVEAIVLAIPRFALAQVALGKIRSLGVQLVADDAKPASDPLRFEKELVFAGVEYTYRVQDDAQPFHIGPIDARFQPGEVVFLVGGNGSGKTTFAKLLCGLYRPAHGTIAVDGMTLGVGEESRYRELFATVFADFHLFDRLLGTSTLADDKKVEGYLERLHLRNKVRLTEGVFSTLQLSQGQRKRLALLVAFLDDRPIYLFDEWAADQDPSFREFFYVELVPALRARGKLVIAISHDDRYFSTADRVMKLDEGRLVGLSEKALAAPKL